MRVSIHSEYQGEGSSRSTAYVAPRTLIKTWTSLGSAKGGLHTGPFHYSAARGRMLSRECGVRIWENLSAGDREEPRNERATRLDFDIHLNNRLDSEYG